MIATTSQLTIQDVKMKALISRLTVISALLFPALSSAVVIPGNIHHGRYTFFLTEEGGEMLRDMNDAAVRVKLNNKAGFAVEAQRMAAAANISPLLYAASPLEENFIRYDSKPVKALTCLITSRNMPGTNKNYSWEETYCLDETGAAYIGTQGWPSRTIFDKSCGVGASDCPVYLSLKMIHPPCATTPHSMCHTAALTVLRRCPIKLRIKYPLTKLSPNRMDMRFTFPEATTVLTADSPLKISAQGKVLRSQVSTGAHLIRKRTLWLSIRSMNT